MLDEYDASQIVVLKGLDPVKKRPGMYVGDTDDGTGLFVMLMEIVSNSIDQFLAGKASLVSITLFDNGDVEVVDDGEGIPIYEFHGKSVLEIIMTTLHAGATWDNHRPHTHVGTLIGIGLAPVNALCDYVDVDSFKDGTQWRMRFENGYASDLIDKGTTEKTGTRILFHPSAKYFSSLVFDKQAISSRFEELSFLCRGLTLQLKSSQEDIEKFYSPNGIVGYLEKIMSFENRAYRDKVPPPVLHFDTIEKNTKVELALCWSGGPGHQRSFANHLCTNDGGVHVDAVTLGLTKAVSIQTSATLDVEAWSKRLTKGLYLIVHVNVGDPQFSSPTKDRLINGEVFNAVIEVTFQQAKGYFKKNGELLHLLQSQD
ncbi:hypothetical protein A9Q99_26000 [Gammaproteobacteria bacterium 45_16_T64]|nr:hypothetical protein A9Q99_26000 [Gammaproteobacteria bacterium 45_16_T64]